MRDFKTKEEFEQYQKDIIRMHDIEGIALPKIAIRLGISSGKCTMIYKNLDSKRNSPYRWEKSRSDIGDVTEQLEKLPTRTATIEDEFDLWAKKQGYIVHKNGFPDRVIEKDGEYKFIEIKNRDEKLRENQKIMHKILEKCGLTVMVVKPDHLSFVISE